MRKWEPWRILFSASLRSVPAQDKKLLLWSPVSLHRTSNLIGLTFLNIRYCTQSTQAKQIPKRWNTFLYMNMQTSLATSGRTSKGNTSPKATVRKNEATEEKVPVTKEKRPMPNGCFLKTYSARRSHLPRKPFHPITSKYTDKYHKQLTPRSLGRQRA